MCLGSCVCLCFFSLSDYALFFFSFVNFSIKCTLMSKNCKQNVEMTKYKSNSYAQRN